MSNNSTPNTVETPKGSTPETNKGIENHNKAAMHHEQAAKHHLKAAKHVELGQHPEASHSTLLAHGHALIANETTSEETKRQALKSTAK